MPVFLYLVSKGRCDVIQLYGVGYFHTVINVFGDLAVLVNILAGAGDGMVVHDFPTLVPPTL